MNGSRRLPRRNVDGVLLFDKPSGIGSNSVLQHVRRIFNAAKAGHTGTLDPMASGLLPICFGEATKFSAELLHAEKQYHATVHLGTATDSGDADGRVIDQRPVDCTFSDIKQVADTFRGEIEQLPPMFSALKRGGRPLYEYARAGIEIQRSPRIVCIHKLVIKALTPISFEMFVHCSKGTYIRSLAIDIGERLGCGAHLSGLRRVAIGGFGIDDAVTLEQLESRAVPHIDGFLRPVDHLVGGVEAITLTADEAARIANGQRLPIKPGVVCDGVVRIFGADRGFMGLGRYEVGILHPLRLILTSSLS